MRKYFLGLSALVAAVGFVAFTRPFAIHTFMLVTQPISVNVVNNPFQWRTSNIGGSLFGNCSNNISNLACTITVDQTTMANYYHASGAGFILNDEAFARANGKRFLNITESLGVLDGTDQYRIVDPSAQIVAMKIVSNVAVQDLNVSLGTDFSYFNGDL